MLLLDKAPAEIWKLLLPEKNILFYRERKQDDLIFYYRNYVYFVHHDGAVIRMTKPEDLFSLQPEDLWECLFHDRNTFDYDEHGIFSIGSILLDIGFMVPAKLQGIQSAYRISLINMQRPDQVYDTYDMTDVTFQYALYQSLLQCHVLNEQTDGEYEYEVQEITRLDEVADQRHFPF